MFCLLLALQLLSSVICYYDNTIKLVPNRYINENTRSKRAVYINGIVGEDVEKHLESERRSAIANATVKRSARSTDKAENSLQNKTANDKGAVIRPAPSVNLTANNRWEGEITDILNRQKPASYDKQINVNSERHAYPWDITELLRSDREKPFSDGVAPNDKEKTVTFAREANRWDITELLSDRENQLSDRVAPAGEVNRWDNAELLSDREEASNLLTPNTKPKRGETTKHTSAVSLKPGEWKRITIVNGTLTANKDLEKENSNKKLRYRVSGEDDYNEFNVVQHLIKNYVAKHPEAISSPRIMPKRNKNRYRRFNLNQDLLKLEPPKDLLLKTRDFVSESSEVPMNNQGSAEDQLSVQPQPYEFTPLTDEEHQCTRANDGVLGDGRLFKEIKLYLENDQATGMVHIDTRRVCPSATGLTVKACDKIRPYVFLIPTTHFEFDVMVVRIQHKKSAQVTIAVSCAAEL